MNKVLLIILIIILLVMASVGYYLRGFIVFFSTNKVTHALCSSNLIHAVIGYNSGKLDTLDNCIYTVAANRNKVELCEQSSTIAAKDSCYSGMAMIFILPDTCEKISTQQGRDYCYAHIAVWQNMPELCQKVVGQYYKDKCASKDKAI